MPGPALNLPDVARGIDRCNVADRVAHFAAILPHRVAVAAAGRHGYATCTFAELDADATSLARGLIARGVRRGMRLALLVPPGVEFVKLAFALLRSGATGIFVDPGMGRRDLVECLAAAEPEGFVGVSLAQALRVVAPRKFSQARVNVTVGRRWFWAGTTYRALLKQGAARQDLLPMTQADDAAAIIFTSGSTGPPKGVLYTQRMFDAQASEIQRAYQIAPGGVDLACFALFGLFNAAMGVTTVFPRMNFSEPGSADPRDLLSAANEWRVTQAFASPTVWDNLSRHCETTGAAIGTLQQIISCGAPVRASVIERTLPLAHAGATMHTPYGATEGLPIATIDAREVLDETAARTRVGAGVCVGRKFDSIEWRVIRVTDEAIATIDDAEEVPLGEIGELVVRGPQVSPRYVVDAGTENANAGAKIADGAAIWHRMGDVGYLDEQGRFWYCGRKSHRVETRHGPLYSVPIEAVFDTLPGVRQSALVGVATGGFQEPVMVIELEDPQLAAGRGAAAAARRSQLISSWHEIEPVLERLWHARDGHIPLKAILFHPQLPVDVRHNAKINREALAEWAAEALKSEGPTRHESSPARGANAG
jgi:acyl-CoA synthetase (AMP-forming)/AMP-acid ligase II